MTNSNPLETKVNFFVFRDLSADDLNLMQTMKNKSDIRNHLNQKMEIDCDDGFPQEVMSDFHYHKYCFVFFD